MKEFLSALSQSSNIFFLLLFLEPQYEIPTCSAFFFHFNLFHFFILSSQVALIPFHLLLLFFDFLSTSCFQVPSSTFYCRHALPSLARPPFPRHSLPPPLPPSFLLPPSIPSFIPSLLLSTLTRPLPLPLFLLPCHSSSLCSPHFPTPSPPLPSLLPDTYLNEARERQSCGAILKAPVLYLDFSATSMPNFPNNLSDL